MEKALKKLGYKDQDRALLINAPEDIKGALLEVFKSPPSEELSEDQEFILFFARELKDVREAAETLAASLRVQGRLWVLYPKKSSRNYTSDLSRDILWDAFSAYGMEAVSNFALDNDWSSIRFRPVSEIRSMKRKNAATKEGRARVEKDPEK